MKISTDPNGIPSGLGPTPRTEIDFSYLERYGSRKIYKIPTMFMRGAFPKGQLFEARITHIYDLSKFWIVTKFRELDIFQKYLFRFYYMNRVHYKIPEDKIALELYCVAFVDSAYYRGVIIGFPDTQQEKQEVQVYFIDYGMIGSAVITNVYYLAEKFMKIPQFSVRASLASICPLKTDHWTTDDVVKFHELVVDKVLVGRVVNIDLNREVIEVYLSEKKLNLSPVHEILISQQHARYVCNSKHDNGSNGSSGNSHFKYPYLFPLHETLESGKLPTTTADADFQLQINPLSLISKYYRNLDISENGTDSGIDENQVAT